MKKRKMILLIILIFLISISLMQIKSYAGLTVTSSGTRADKKTTSNAFAYCYNLRVSTSTLGDNTLDPHLMLNSDFATAFYLGVSSYGRGSLAGLVNASANGNNSGIFCTGEIERTSAIRENYYSTSSNKSYFTNLIAYKDTNYVELLPESLSSDSNTGKALNEIQSWSTWIYGPNYTASVEYWTANYDTSLIGLGRAHFFPSKYFNDAGRGSGVNSGYYFRPVIWN